MVVCAERGHSGGKEIPVRMFALVHRVGSNLWESGEQEKNRRVVRMEDPK